MNVDNPIKHPLRRSLIRDKRYNPLSNRLSTKRKVKYYGKRMNVMENF